MTDYLPIIAIAAVVAVVLFVINRKRNEDAQREAAPLNAMAAEAWRHELAIKMPDRPLPHAEGFCIDFPQPTEANGSVHYVTRACDPLAGKSRIVMTGRIEAAPGVRLVPREFPLKTATLSLYFQREGDKWTAETQDYRWWGNLITLAPGEFGLIAEFSSPHWVSALGTRANNMQGFANALAGACRVGFTLGGGDGRGHGAYATGPARLVVTSFRVE